MCVCVRRDGNKILLASWYLKLTEFVMRNKNCYFFFFFIKMGLSHHGKNW